MTEVSVIEKIKECGVLKVGMTLDYKPMSYIDFVTGSYAGYDDLLDYVNKFLVDFKNRSIGPKI